MSGKNGASGRPGRRLIGLAVLTALAAVAILVRLMVYRDAFGSGVEWAWPDPAVARFRLTQVAVAAITGTALAVSGVLLQALLRNPLASPFILGVSSGASLGVMIALYVGWRYGVPALRAGSHGGAAGVGAMATLAIVYMLGQRRGWLDPLSLILIGVVMSAICGALIMFLNHLVPMGLRGDLVTWMAGSINEGTSPRTLLITGVLTAIGAAVAMGMGRAMDAATLGDDEARSVGLALGRLRLVLYLVAGLLAAIAVTLAGPIGFVGLIAPHAARMVLGPQHTRLVLGASLVGIILLVAGNVASQLMSVEGTRMPIGVFTALIGGIAFIWLLRTGRGQA